MGKERTQAIVIAMLMTILLYTPAGAIVITFEEGLGNNGGVINNQYQGVTFQGSTTGIPWYYSDVTTGIYNASSWPSGQSWGSGEYWMNNYVCAWTSVYGDNGKIAFNAQNASYVRLNYSSYSQFYLEAYNPQNSLIASMSGPANLRYSDGNPNGPGTLFVNAPQGDSIAYVLVHDMGNYWVVDNVVTDASGIAGPGDLQIVKFFDGDMDGQLDGSERLISGWDFLVEGPNGYSQLVTTGAGGSVTLSDLSPGQYTITESGQPGWTPTTQPIQVIDVVEGQTAVAEFGNVPEPATLGLLALGVFITTTRRR